MLNSQDALLACKKCYAKTSASTMKYNSTGDYLICAECYEKEHGASKRELPSLGSERMQQSARAQLDRVQYQCTSCKYVFSRRVDVQTSKCPYCNRGTAAPMNPSAFKKDNEQKKEKGLFFDVDDLL